MVAEAVVPVRYTCGQGEGSSGERRGRETGEGDAMSWGCPRGRLERSYLWRRRAAQREMQLRLILNTLSGSRRVVE